MSEASSSSAPATRKTTLYRLICSGTGDGALRNLVDSRYRDRTDFRVNSFQNGPLHGIIVTGTQVREDARWCSSMSRITGTDVSERNHTAFGLLIVRTENHVYGLTYGMGYVMLRAAAIDPGFALEFAVRCLDEQSITRVRRQVMDARGRSDDDTATSGEHIRGFGIEEYGEIVNRIAGRITDIPLTFTRGGKRSPSITASDQALTLHLGESAEALETDLHHIEEVCAKPDPIPELKFLTQVRPLRPRSETATRLDDLLDEQLGKADPNPFSLIVPESCLKDYDNAEGFQVTGFGAKKTWSTLSVPPLLDLVADRPPGERLDALRKGRVVMWQLLPGTGSDGHPASGRIRADHWLTANIPENGVNYFYSGGRWYAVGNTYLASIKSRVEELLSAPSDVFLPPWPSDIDEGIYNKEIVGKRDGYLKFDKDNVHTKRLHGGGLELCDVLGPRGELIHVKKADRNTAPLNHLFAQARISLETLRYDDEARGQFLAKVASTRGSAAPDLPWDPTFGSATVVLGIRLKAGKRITADTLFPFSQLTLLHLETELRGMGARLQVVSIPQNEG